MKKRALIIDDNEKNLILENDLLEVFGFEVLTAQNASDGVAAAVREKPDIVIMDVRLPDMRGTEAAKILRDNEVTRSIPIVFVTASVMSENIQEIKEISDSGLVGKPINTRTFAGEISKFLK